MSSLYTVVFTILAALAAGLDASQPASPSALPARCEGTSAASGEAALAVARGIIDADNRRALEEVMRYYGSEAVLWPPNEPPVRGTAAIRPRYEGLFSRFTPSLAASIDSVCASDRLAVVVGRNTGRMVARDGGVDRPVNDAYLMVLESGADGAWRIAHLAWSGLTGVR
jgi:ketosteroid isomerase-like protein